MLRKLPEVALVIALSMLFSLCPVALAQRSPLDPTERAVPTPLQPLSERPPQRPLEQLLPPLPPLNPDMTPQGQLLRVFVRAITVTGSTVFEAATLAQITAPYVQREVTTEDLEALRLDLTRLYVTHGYINSGAILPDQTVQDGVITFHIIEGQLNSVEVQGQRWFRADYLSKRLALDIATPLNIAAVQQRLQLLQQDERIARLQAELRPGVQPGESALHVRVEETAPFNVALAFNNYQSPTVGAERGSVTLTHQNLTGHGDVASVTYGYSAGVDAQIDASYTLPLTVRDTTLNVRYRRNASLVIEEPFAPLDLESTSEVYGITLRHPFHRTLTQEFAAELTGEYLHNKTVFFGGVPFFAPGAENGVSTIAALRLAVEWTERTARHVFALRSRFTLGIDALGATVHADTEIPDGQFFAWAGQAQWVQLLNAWGLQAMARVDVQLSPEPLLSVEQFAVGGRASVRGYRENTLVRDQGISASLEARLPLIRQARWAEVLQLAPFLDVGHAWNASKTLPESSTLVSIGIGIRWALTLTTPLPLRPELEVYWGWPLRRATTVGGDLQDLGVHVQCVITGF